MAERIELDNLGEKDKFEDAREESEQAETSVDEGLDFPTRITNWFGLGCTSTPIRDRSGNDRGDSQRVIESHLESRGARRFDSIRALETSTNLEFNVHHGPDSEALIDGVSGERYDDSGKLIALKFKGEDVKLTTKGEVHKGATKQNKKF